MIRVVRKNIRGRVGPVSRKKKALPVYPIHPELAEILREHRRRLLEDQAPGVDSGWVFPSATGGLRTPSGLWKAWRACLKESKIADRFTVHGLRRTFNDLTRRAGVDGVVIKSLTGHVTEQMRSHYSTVGIEEKLVSSSPSRACTASFRSEVVMAVVMRTARRKKPVRGSVPNRPASLSFSLSGTRDSKTCGRCTIAHELRGIRDRRGPRIPLRHAA